MLGDFDKYGKVRPERGSVHVPLVVAGPGVRENICSDALVELQDLARTIVEYAGADMPEAVDSLSLKPILEGTAESHREVQISALNGWKMASDGEYKLIIENGKEPRLYHLPSDPWENRNVARQHEDVVKRLQAQLTS
jgi:arylsulfatase A-like enzyme